MENEMTVREALLAMGYREAKPGRWAKPVAFQLFVFDEASGAWTNWFLDAKGALSAWESKVLGSKGNSPDALRFLKESECWTRIDMYCSKDSHFELSALDL